MDRNPPDPEPHDNAEVDRRAHAPEKDTGEANPAETIQDSRGENAERLPASKIGRYRLIRSLGEGGMGSVYLAADELLDRKVALKIPKLAGKNPEKVHKRFLREARAAAGLQHRNICQVHDIGEVDGQPYIAMAYLEGKQLSKFIRPDRPIEPRKAATVIRKIALAIHEAHKSGVVHRDLKPANVIVEPNGEPVVMDFGLAAPADSVDSDSRLTKDGAIIGTPTYMPPEQVEGEIENIGPRSDIYSLGIILYEMLRGRPPFEGTTASVLGQVVVVQPEPLLRHIPDLDHDLNALCMSMIAKSPDQRPQSMLEVARTLTTYVRNQSPGELPAVTPPPVGTHFQARNEKSSQSEPKPSVVSAAKGEVLPKTKRRTPRRSLLLVLAPVIITAMVFAFLITILALRTVNMSSPSPIVDGGSSQNDIVVDEDSDTTDEDSINGDSTEGESASSETPDDSIIQDSAVPQTSPGNEENSTSDNQTIVDDNHATNDEDTDDAAAVTETQSSDSDVDRDLSMPDQILVQTMVEADGMVTEQFVICQSLLITEFKGICQSLSEFGYRPVRYRPYLRNNELRTAAIWHRMPGVWEVAGPLSREEIEIRHVSAIARGMGVVDAWGLIDADGNEQFFGVWTDGSISFGPSRATWGQSNREFKESIATFAQDGFVPTTVQLFHRQTDDDAITTVFHQSPLPIEYVRYSKRSNLEKQLAPATDLQCLDITVGVNGGVAAYTSSSLRADDEHSMAFEFNVEPGVIVEKTRSLAQSNYVPIGVSSWEDSNGDLQSAATWKNNSPMVEPFATATQFDFDSLKPDSANEWLELGLSSLASNRRSQALYAFSRSIDEGGPAQSHIERARLCQTLHLKHAAIADLNHAIARGAPSDVYVARAEIYAAVGEWQAALSDLGIAQRKDEDNIAVTQAMARLLAIADVPVADSEKSLEFAKEAYAADPSPASIFTMILSCAANDQESRVDQYRRDLMDSVEGRALEDQLSEDLKRVLLKRFRRGRSLFFNERTNLAAEEFQGIVSLCPSHEDAWFWLGRAWLEEERYQSAVSSFQEHVDCEPNSQAGHHYLGRALFFQGKHEAAIASFTQSIDLQSSSSESIVDDLCWRARSFLIRNQPELAVDDLERAIRADSDHIGATELLARIRATCASDGLRDGEQAVELATHAAELTGRDNATVMDTLACAYAESGRVAQAFGIMQSMINEEFGRGQPFGFKGPEDMMRRMNRFRNPTPVRESSRELGQRPLVED